MDRDEIAAATAALESSEEQSDAVIVMLQADREERRISNHRELRWRIITAFLIAVDLIALGLTFNVVSKVRSVQKEGVTRAKATKSNTDELKRLAKSTNAIALETHRTAAQLDCAFEVATANPGISQEENLRLVNECVAERTRAP